MEELVQRKRRHSVVAARLTGRVSPALQVSDDVGEVFNLRMVFKQCHTTFLIF